MNYHQAFTALQWFGYKEDCLVGYQEDDLPTIDALLEIIKDKDEPIPNRTGSYKDYHDHFVKYLDPRINKDYGE